MNPIDPAAINLPPTQPVDITAILNQISHRPGSTAVQSDGGGDSRTKTGTTHESERS